MEIITNKGTGVAFFTLMLFASTWYHIKKVKQHVNESKNKCKQEA